MLRRGHIPHAPPGQHHRKTSKPSPIQTSHIIISAARVLRTPQIHIQPGKPSGSQDPPSPLSARDPILALERRLASWGGVAVDLSALLKPPVHLNIVSQYTPHIAPHVCLKPRGPFCLGTSPVDLKWLWVGVEKRQSPPDRRGTKEVPCLASTSMYTPLPSTKPHFSTFALLLNFLFVLLRQPSSAFTLHLPAPPTASLGKYTR